MRYQEKQSRKRKENDGVDAWVVLDKTGPFSKTAAKGWEKMDRQSVIAKNGGRACNSKGFSQRGGGKQQ